MNYEEIIRESTIPDTSGASLIVRSRRHWEDSAATQYERFVTLELTDELQEKGKSWRETWTERFDEELREKLVQAIEEVTSSVSRRRFGEPVWLDRYVDISNGCRVGFVIERIKFYGYLTLNRGAFSMTTRFRDTGTMENLMMIIDSSKH